MKKISLILFIILIKNSILAQVNVVSSSGILSGSYSTLKSAFDAINAGTHTGSITINLGSASNQTITETSQPVLNKNGNGAASYTGILITPAFSNITINASFSGACCTPSGILNFNAANNIMIDGRIGSSGSINDLTIENTSTGSWASAIVLNGASNNTIRYCNIKSSGLPTSSGIGTLSFLYNGTTASGAQNNTVEYCNITKSGTNLPNVAIASNSGNSVYKNANNTISNCNISEFKKYGVWLGNSGATTYDDLWTIQGNNFFESSSITIDGTNYANYAIMVGYHNAGGTTYYNTPGKITISNNVIGGNGLGGDWTVTSTSGNSGLVAGGIYVGAGTANFTEISGNQIRKFNVTTYVNNNATISGFNGIYAYNTKVKVGSSAGNKIYDILLDHKSTWGGVVSGISVRTNTNLLNEIKNNEVYNITAEAGSAYFQFFYGIYDFANSSVFSDVISNNKITKINLNLNSNCWGIYGSGQMYQNHVSKIKISNGTADLVGIQFMGVPSGTQSTNRVDNNEIILGFDDAGNSTAADRAIYGIVMNSAGYAYYNSILIQGNHAGSTNSCCLKLNTSSGSGYVAVNNLLYNARTGGSGKQYCIMTTGSNTISSSNNAYIFEGSNNYTGIWNNTTDCSTLASWLTISGETNSINDTKTNKPISILLPNANLAINNNLTPISNGWLCAGKVVNQNVDFNNTARNGSDPTTIGAYELNCPTILPIELVHFKVACDNNKKILSWETASEINNSFFTIERSMNGIDFNTIATVAGAGNSNQNLQYLYEDFEVFSKKVYYRLKQTDYNGESRISYIVVSAPCLIKNNKEIVLYPNPVTDKITISSTQALKTGTRIQIITSEGKNMMENIIVNPLTSITLHFNSNVNKGIYLILIKDNEGFVYTSKFIKK